MPFVFTLNVFTIDIKIMNSYVEKLIENIPTTNNKCINIDLVLDGGIFNGSYLVGALSFLKEMEKKKFIKIKRISGCSVGSLIGFLYFIDKLDIIFELYKDVHIQLKQDHNLSLLKNLHAIVKNFLPVNICDIVKKKLYITFYNLKLRKKCIKSVYTSETDITNTIIKSCFVPYLIDGNLLFEKKYIDGINPYMFKSVANRKILYLDLFGLDKINNVLNIKNEKTNFHRVLTGILDIHNFFIKNCNTNMCSYTENWNISHNLSYILKIIIEKIIIYSLFLYSTFKPTEPIKKQGFFNKLIYKMTKDTFVLFLDYYCI
jgi:hypothetical protein